MTNEESKKPADTAQAKETQAKPAPRSPAGDEETRPDREPTTDELIEEMEEDLRRFRKENDERILEMWRSRGLFGFTTSTG